MADSAVPAPRPPAMPVVIDNSRPCKEYQYAAKVVSGVPGDQIEREIVAPGRYFTAINIHNPSTCKTVTFRWKVAVAAPVGFPFGRITRFQKITLRPDQAVEIDSPNITRALGWESIKFVKGFVVIESPCELDVVTVNTVGSVGNTPAPVQSGAIAFHTERVPSRLIDACHEDLNMNISTGQVDWMLTSAVANNGVPFANITTPRPANVIENDDRHPVWGTQKCGRWVGVRGVAHDLKPGVESGVYTFQHCFSLCSGFENARIDMTVLVDDNATVWLNNIQVGAVSGYSAPATLAITNQDAFQPGLNCLTFVVTNMVGPAPAGNPVGINVCGTVKADRGACGGCGCSSDCGCGGSIPKAGVAS